MFGFITKRAHDAEIAMLTTARDGLVDCLNRAERQNQELTAKLRDALEDVDALTAGTVAMKNRITNMQKDIDRLEAEANANARFVEVGKKRLAALDRQNRYAKALRKARRDQAAADLPPCVDVMPSDRKAKGRASA